MIVRPQQHAPAQTLMSLPDQTRRAIVQRLVQGEARVTDLPALFPMSLNAVSKHFRGLERADLVRQRRAGREHYLSLNSAPMQAAAAWIADQEAAWMRGLMRSKSRGVMVDEFESSRRPHGFGTLDCGHARIACTARRGLCRLD